MTAPVASVQRFTKDRPCPICGGHQRAPQGRGERCYGFLSDDESYAHCTREEHAGGLPLGGAETYAHRLEASCKCGVTHGAAAPSPSRRPPRRLSDDHFKDCEAGSPWDYRDESGAVLYRKARHAGKRFAFYHRNGDGTWTDGRGTDRSVLLDLPRVLDWIKAPRLILLAEGEAKARALQALGFAATTNDAGAKGFSLQDAECSRGAPHVVVVLDNDKDGRERGALVPPLLHAVGVGTIQVLSIPGAEGEGVDDWLQRRRGKTDETVKAELAALVCAAQRWTPPLKSTVTPDRKATPWDAAQDVHDFINASEPDSDFLVPRLIARGVVTAWYSPRGLGKTLIAHWIAAELARRGVRVLLIDRDNPRREVRRRLRAWGLAGLDSGRFKIIHRDKAPPLTDAKAWAAFPVNEYDLVILDSFDSSAEGVGEQDSAKSSLAVAALLDVVRSAAGPGALVLGNTIKSGSHGRGSGVLEDRLDIVFEVRDATGFKPSGTKDWWLELPASGRDAWADRASRRKKRDSYRLAFVPSKYRVGEEPVPFAFEVRCAVEPWTCSEVTAELVQEGEQSMADAARARAAQLEKAAKELGEQLASQKGGAGLARNDAAIPFLMDLGLSQKAARELIRDRDGALWRLSGTGRKSDPITLLPPDSEKSLTGNTPTVDADKQQTESVSIPVGCVDCGPQESVTTEPAPDAAPADPGFLPASAAMPPCQFCGGRVLAWGKRSICSSCHKFQDTDPLPGQEPTPNGAALVADALEGVEP